MYISIERQNTPAKDRLTLFVEGSYDVETISNTARINECEHIYLGVNHTYDESPKWAPLIRTLLDEGFWVSLEIDVTQWEYFLEDMGDHADQLIPIVSVKMPYSCLANYNTVVKIDDTDFRRSTDGVWCHSLHDLKDRAKFTPWADFL